MTKYQFVPIDMNAVTGGMKLTEEQMAPLYAEIALNQTKMTEVAELYREQLLAGETPVFTPDRLIDEDHPNEIITRFYSQIATVYTINDIPHLKTTAGDTISLEIIME